MKSVSSSIYSINVCVIALNFLNLVELNFCSWFQNSLFNGYGFELQICLVRKS